MENEEQELNTEVFAYTVCNNKKCVFKNAYNLYKKENIENNPLEIGPSLAYTYMKIKENNLNSASVGGNIKFKLDDYKLFIVAKQDFRYINLNFEKDYSNNYYNFNGGVNAKLYIDKKVNIIPELRFSYEYGLNSEFKDQNNDLIKIKPIIDFSLGIGLNLEYVFGDKTKIKLGGGYAFDKEFYNKNKYMIFNKIVNKDIKETMNHTAKIYTIIVLNNKHNIKFLLDYKNKMYGGAISYNVNW